MTKLIATRGYSGSGKSFWASLWLEQDVDNRLVLNRDDLRRSLFASDGVLSQDKESLITKIQRTAATTALENGKDVCLADTNLRAKLLREWADLAADCGAEFEVKDFEVDVETCLANNRARANNGGRLVPENAIRNQAKRFPYPWKEIKPRPNLKMEAEPYEPQEGLPTVVICDIDGTVADMSGNGRNPFDLSRVSEDEPIQYVIDLVNLLAKNHKVIFFSGREDRENCKADSIAWLEKHVMPDVELYMRPTGDNRTDFIVKSELFDEHVRGKYNVVAVFDDRLQVARLWNQIGLPLFRVGDPDAKF